MFSFLSLFSEQLPQSKVNDAYLLLHDLVTNALQDATANKKPLHVVVGETHGSKNSILIETMLWDILARLNIRVFLVESISEFLDQGLNICSSTPEKCDPRLKGALDRKFLLRPLEHYSSEKHSKHMSARGDEFEKLMIHQREQDMAETIKGTQEHALAIVGSMHLQGVLEKMDSKKSVILVINAYSPDVTNQKTIKIMHETQSLAELYQRRTQFLKSEKINTVYLISNKISLKVNEIEDMVREARKNAINMFDNKIRVDSRARVQTELHSATSAPTTVALPAVVTPGRLPASGPVATTSSLVASDLSTISSPELCYPTETALPWNVLAQIGFWAASKLGWCATPSSVVLPEISTKGMISDLRDEMAAEKTLSEQDSSLESSLIYLFGKRYIQGDTTSKMMYKNFFVDVVNGSVDKTTGKKFNELAQIGNAHERAKQIDKLRRSVTGETRSDRQARRP